MEPLVCIVCPRGCTLTVQETAEGLTVTGNACPRGKAFAQAEHTNPMRTLCTTVATTFTQVPVLPVRVSAEIPKGRMRDVMAAANAVTVTAPLRRGEPVIENVCGLGVDLIATSDLLYESTGGTNA